jgi:sarcosine/dimethylglycine N-methyltransferase
MDASSVESLVAAIREVVQTRGLPAPRGLPYLGLEQPSGTSADLLHLLSTRGIFRKYELVLDVDAGLGGTARWLAQRLGCEVVGAVRSAHQGAAAADLSRRARLASHVRVAVADPAALPVRAGRFTHAWIVEALPRLADPERALMEAARAVRPGGTLAVQDLILPDAATRADVPGWRPVTAAERRASVARAGFVDIEVVDRSAEAAERSAPVVAARERLLRLLAARAPRLAAERAALAAALAAGTLRVVHLLARRP